MADSDALRPYTPGSYPSISDGEAKFITAELNKLKQSVTLLIQVVKQLETRIAAGGL